MKQKNTTPQRLGAAALATATVVSGLAFGPGAVAAPAPSMSAVTPAASFAPEPAAATPAADVGPFVAASTGSFNVAPGEVSDVKVRLRATRLTGAVDPRLTLTAPEGMTFPDQSTATAMIRSSPDSNWVDWSYSVGLAGGVVTNGGKTLTFDRTVSGSTVQLQAEGQIEYTVKVRADAQAVDRPNNTLGFVYSGQAMLQDFSASGTVRTTSANQIGPFVAAPTGSFNVAPGEVSDVKVRLRATRLTGAVDPRLTLTAPEGMTFPDQSTATAMIRSSPDSNWVDWSYSVGLAGGVVTNGGKTLTFDRTVSGSTVQLQAEGQIEYTVKVLADPQAVERPNNMLGFVYSGQAMLNGFRAPGAVPVSTKASFGALAANTMAPMELSRGAEREVTFEAKVADEFLGRPSAEVTLTAPQGTTFAEGQDEIAGAFVRDGQEDPAGMRLTGGDRSADGRSYTYTWDTEANGADAWQSPKDEILRWKIAVVTPADAADVEDNAMQFVLAGTSTQGAFRAAGSAPVTVVGDFGSIAPVAMAPVELTRGADTEVTFETKVAGDALRLPVAEVTVTAPEGTVFDAGQDEITGAYVRDGRENTAGMQLKGGVRSADGRTYTYTWDTAANGTPGWQSPRDEVLRWKIAVTTPADAADVDGNAMGYTFVGTSAQGGFQATGSAPVTFASSYADVTLDNLADGDTFTPGDVTFSGTGTPGATVTVAPSTGAGVSTEVRADGTWSAVRYLGNASYTMSVSQKAASGENTIENIRLFSDAVVEQDFSVTTPRNDDGHTQQGWVTFTGVGTTWSTVSISDGSDTAATKATVQYDGTWSARRWVGTEKTTFTVTSSRADVQNGSQTIEFNTGVSGQAFSLDSHTDGGTFTPGNIVFRGKGSTGDKVTFTAPGLAPLEATVNAAGEWSIPRWLGNGFITFTVTHTPVTGDETKQTLRLYSDQVAQGDLVVTSPVDGDGHTQPGWVTFTGTGTTWSKVSVSDGTSAAPSTATVQIDGSWTVRRWVGTAATTFTVSSERGGVSNGSETIEFNVGDVVGDFTIGSHTDGGTFTPGNVAISGTGTTGDKVTIAAPGLAPLETEVDSRGRWSIQRWLGNGFITFTVTHTPVTGDETKQTLRLFSDQVAQGDLVVTAPVEGDSHTAPGFVTFTGTGTTWSKVSISDGTSAAPSVATVQYDGSWTVRRWVGTAPVTFTVTSERAGIANGSQTIRFNTAE
ncbi:hypothetical protein [Frigoribacterium sp. CFBP9030]|uniref:hypothetical protein n=1 Tax=Frigoribacterium sp. CFBP9030 TaxID=3096537 RepID=UPI002A6B60CB|nr:hypothetical protein [Frigoribacterium sp. CFBP9030]MDY0892649.1 hypothetical protein [Frigoribacterium sp. CFBP9030]